MPIPESQLETWSHQGATTTASITHASIRHALSAHAWPSTVDYEVYLQGSYRNHTNIRGDSDVDLVVQLNSSFKHELSALSEAQVRAFHATYSDTTYHWGMFRAETLRALKEYYGASLVTEGHKSLKVSGASGRLNADVVPCLMYRKYRSSQRSDLAQYVKGIAFYSLPDLRLIVNFPKLHYANGAAKNADDATKGLFKPAVRVLKNARNYLVDHQAISDQLAPSYFIECLAYNLPNDRFSTDHRITFLGFVTWAYDILKNDSYRRLKCQNEQLPLFGSEPEQWSVSNAIQLLGALMTLWSDWE